MAIALWRLSTNADYRTIGHLFGVAKGTACVVANEVCCAVVEELFRKYVKIPSGKHFDEVVEEFENKWGFSHCAGAVAGSHIPIIAPTFCPKDYYNRKGFHSIILQGLVDHQYRFLDINVGWPGSVHDARVFANSELYSKAERKTLFPPKVREINGVPVPLVILGDPAYPLLQWVMKPYTDNGRLSRQQSTFNYRLSRARVVTENAFGRLKGRWRCLMKRNDTDLDQIPTLITACVILHNICEIHEDHVNSDWLSGNDGAQTDFSVEARNIMIGTAAEAIRTAFATYFSST